MNAIPKPKKFNSLRITLILTLEPLSTRHFYQLKLDEFKGKIEFHYTPKHGSWLNMALIELSVLNRQCLDRRIAHKEVLKQEIATWEKRRNELSCKVDWQFTTEDARIKLKRLYPSISY
jgi:hypothetical protein